VRPAAVEGGTLSARPGQRLASASYHRVRMRRGASTVVALVGEVREELLVLVTRSSNVAVVRADGEGLEGALRASAAAEGRAAPYVVLAADPLAEVAREWRAMWEPRGNPSSFEVGAGEALSAWRAGRLQLPDYYLVVAAEPADVEPTAPHPHDLHLGVLREERPSRVVLVLSGEVGEEAARVLTALRSLRQGPWWPPLDRLVEAIRGYFPSALGGRAADLSVRPREP
jgi:hypothetical protein